jgi:THO complex subunit 5
MTSNEIIREPNLVAAINASRDARIQALALVDQVAAAGSLESASAEALLEISKQQKLLITHLAQVRGLHRAATFSTRKTKAETAEARQEVDRLHLQLQNLYYEQRHLQGEIADCESYEYVFCLNSSLECRLIIGNSHTYQQLPLIPIEEFLSLKPDHAEDDENALMIARIEHERAERESLEQKRMELLKRKQKLIADNKKRKDDLANLDKELEKFIDVCILHCGLLNTNTNAVLGCQTHSDIVREKHYLVAHRRLTKTHTHTISIPVVLSVR